MPEPRQASVYRRPPDYFKEFTGIANCSGSARAPIATGRSRDDVDFGLSFPSLARAARRPVSGSTSRSSPVHRAAPDCTRCMELPALEALPVYRAIRRPIRPFVPAILSWFSRTLFEACSHLLDSAPGSSSVSILSWRASRSADDRPWRPHDKSSSPRTRPIPCSSTGRVGARSGARDLAL